MSRLSLKSLGLAVLAAAVTFTVAPVVTLAQSSDVAASHGTRHLVVTRVDDSKLIAYKNSVPAEVKTAEDQGRVGGTTMVSGEIVLHRPAEMQKAVDLLEKSLRTEGDPLYHQWLTPKELASFGPAQHDIVALNGWLKSHNLTTTQVSFSRLVVDFSGSSADVEQAFHTKLHEFKGADGTVSFSNTTSPKVPEALDALIFSPIKLNNFQPELSQNFAGAVVASREFDASEIEIGNVVVPQVRVQPNASTSSFTFTDTPGSQNFGTTTAQTLTVTAAGTFFGGTYPNGTVTITGSGAIGTIATFTNIATSCTESYPGNYPLTTCTYTWNPSAALAVGGYTLTAAYTAGNFTATNTTTPFTVTNFLATSMTASANPTLVDPATPTTAVTGVLSWTGAATPTGTMALTCGAGSAGTCGGLPGAVNLTTCTLNAAAKTYTCTISYALDTDDSAFGTYNMQMTYSGNSTYAGSNATTPVVDSAGDSGTLSVTPNPSGVFTGSGSNVVYTVVFTSTSVTNTPTGTGTVTLSGTPVTGSPLSMSESACTWSTSADTLTCTFTAAVPVATAAGTYTVTASYTGDRYYAPETATTTVSVGNNLTTVSLNPNTVNFGAGTPVVITVTNAYTGSTAPTGTITLSDADGYLAATINLSTCTLNSGAKTYTCTYNWTNASSANTSPDLVTATYSGDGNFSSTSGSANLTVTFSSGGSMLTGFSLTDTPGTQTYGTATPQTVSFTLDGRAGGTHPITGTAVLSGSGGIGYIATLTLPSTSCVAAGNNITCSGIAYTPSATLAVGSYTLTVAYSGSTTYGSTTATQAGALVVSAKAPTLALTPNPVTVASGSVAPVTLTANSTGVAGGTTPGGVVTFTKAAGALGALSPTTCTLSGGTCSVTYTPSAAQAVGTITNAFTAVEAANGNYTASNTATDNLVTTGVTKTTPTFGTMTFSPAASEPYGTSQAITISDTLTYTGSTAPTGAVTFVLNGVTYTATCPGSTSPLTCSAVVPAATIAALPVNTYTVTVAFAGDTNFNATTGTSGTFTITAATPTVSLSNVSAPFGSTAGVAITVTATGDNGATATFGTAGGVGGSFSPTTCVIAANTCSVNYIPSGVLAGGTYANDLTVSVAAHGNYAVGSATSTLTITAIAPTVSLSNVTAPFGSTTPVAITVTATGDNGAVATFGTAGGIGGTFSVATCTIGALTTNICSVNYIPSGTLAAGTYTNDLTVSVAANANGDYTSGSATSTLTITKVAPTDLLTSISAPYGSTAGVMITASSNANGSVVTFGTAGGVGGSFSPATCTIASGSCSVSYIPSGTLPVGTYTNDLTASFAATTNYSAGSANSTLTITTATEMLSLTDPTPGAGTLTPTVGGVTTTTLTATASPAVPDGTIVTFTDVTTGATVNVMTSGNVASFTVTTSTPGVSAGLNMVTASIAATSNTSTAAAGPLSIYLQGILLSAVGNHNFSSDPGTVDGSPVCNGSNGTAGITCVNPFGVTVINFTTSAQTLASTLSAASNMNNAFSGNANCNQTLSPGSQCSVTYAYEPPYGDGTCTYTGGGSCAGMGAYEQEMWAISASPATLFGIGNQGFSRSGKVTTPGGELEGKALLAQGSLTVAPLNHNFGTVGAGVTSGTETINVTNSGAAPVSFTYTGPSAPFTANNNCTSPLGANSTCSIYVTLKDATPGSYSDMIVITPTGGSAIDSQFSGTVTSAAGLTVNASSHSFGNVTDGTSSVFGLSITNNTASPQTLSLMYQSPTGYSHTTNCPLMPTALAAGATCTVDVTFAPTAPGTVNDTVTISSGVPITPGGTGSGNSYSDGITFSGTGVTGGHFTATTITHNFGTLAVGTSGGNYGVQLSNNSGATITLTTGPLSSTTEGFTVVGTSCGATLNNNANCELLFSFTPNATGFVSATYPITGSAPLYFAGSPAPTPNQITLRGTGQ